MEGDFVSDTTELYHKYSEEDNVEKLAQIFPCVQDINGYYPDTTALYKACEQGSYNAVKWLLSNNVDPYLGTDTGISPLHVASNAGFNGIIQELLKHGSDIHYTIEQETALHTACRAGHVEVVALLLSEGSDINCRDIKGATPLHIAVQKSHIKVTELLLEMKADPNSVSSNSVSPLHIASSIGNKNIIELLLEYKADINKCLPSGESPLTIICNREFFSLVPLFLERGASVDHKDDDEYGNTALCYSSRFGNVESVKSLIKYNATVNKQNNKGKTPLAHAVQYGHREVINLLLEAGADSNIADNDNVPPILLTHHNSDIDIVSSLLDCKADLNSADRNGLTALCVFCVVGKSHIVKLLLQKGANMNMCNNDGMFPLHAACLYGHFNCVKLLVEFGALLNQVDKNGVGPLFAASSNGHKDIVQYLIETCHQNINTVTKNGDTPLIVASKNGHTLITQYLIKSGADCNHRNHHKDTALYFASSRGHLEIVKSIISENVDVNASNNNGNTAFYIACQNGYIDIVKTLLPYVENINKINSEGVTPLFVASQEGFADIVELLLKNGADLNETNSGFSPIFAACMAGRLYILQVLNKYGADVNQVTENGITPLYVACEDGSVEVVKLLLKLGSNHTADDNGITPADIACTYGHLECLKCLIESGVQVDIVDKQNRSLLYIACLNDQSEIVKYLIDKQAEIDKVDDDMVTPLGNACVKGCTKAVNVLLKHGANVNVKDKENRTALFHACEAGNVEIISLLIEHKADPFICDINRNSPLHMICSNRQLDSKCQLQGCDLILKVHPSNVNSQNQYGNTPLHEAVGCLNIELCNALLNKGASINQENNIGETSIFLAVKRLSLGLSAFLFSRGAFILHTNCLGRSLLHCSVADLHAVFNGESDSAMIDWLILIGLEVNSCDQHLLTPLHLAVQKKNKIGIRTLLKHGACINAWDRNYLTPIHFATNDIATLKLFLDIAECKEGYIENPDKIQQFSKWNKTALDTENIILDYNLKVPFNMNLECYSTSLTTDNETIMLNQVEKWLDEKRRDERTFCQYWTEILYSNDMENNMNKQIHTEYIEIRNKILLFLEDMLKITGVHGNFDSSKLMLSGSLGEKTKVVYPDEADCLCEFYFSSRFKLPEKSDLDASCVQVIFKDNDKKLRRSEYFDDLYGAISKALQSPLLWEKYPQLYREIATDITQGQRSITHLKLNWHGKEFCYLPFEIDLVPAVAFPSWYPEWCTKHPLIPELESLGCHIVAKWRSGVPENDYLFQLGLNNCDAWLFQNMPPAFTKAYKLCKILKHPIMCPEIEGISIEWFLTSYMLKTSTFWEYEHSLENDVQYHDDIKAVVVIAKRIFERVHRAFERKELESFYLPGYNLIKDDASVKYKHITDAYMTLFKHFLTPKV